MLYRSLQILLLAFWSFGSSQPDLTATIPAYTGAAYLRIFLSPSQTTTSSYINLAELQLFYNGVQLSGLRVVQSSTLSSDGGYPAGNLVDGNTATFQVTGPSDPYPWVAVDITGLLFDTVVIYNRWDRGGNHAESLRAVGATIGVFTDAAGSALIWSSNQLFSSNRQVFTLAAVAAAQKSVVYRTYHSGPRCTNQSTVTDIEMLPLSTCAIDSTSSSFMYQCKFLGQTVTTSPVAGKYTLTKQSYPGSLSCVGTPTKTIVRHDRICGDDDKVQGSYVRTYCGLLPSSLATAARLVTSSFPSSDCSPAIVLTGQAITRVTLLGQCMPIYNRARKFVAYYRRVLVDTARSSSAVLALRVQRYTGNDATCTGTPMGQEEKVSYTYANNAANACQPDALHSSTDHRWTNSFVVLQGQALSAPPSNAPTPFPPTPTPTARPYSLNTNGWAMTQSSTSSGFVLGIVCSSSVAGTIVQVMWTNGPSNLPRPTTWGVWSSSNELLGSGSTEGAVLSTTYSTGVNVLTLPTAVAIAANVNFKVGFLFPDAWTLTPGLPASDGPLTVVAAALKGSTTFTAPDGSTSIEHYGVDFAFSPT